MKNKKELLWVNTANWNGVNHTEPFQLKLNKKTKIWNGIDRPDGYMSIHKSDLKLNIPFYNKVYATQIFASKAKTRVVSWMKGVESMQNILLDTIPSKVKNKTHAKNKK